MGVGQNDGRPLAARGWIRDQMKFAVLMLALAALIVFAVGGPPFLRGLMVDRFGNRPVGATDARIESAYFRVALPVCFLLWAGAVAAALRTYRSWRRLPLQLAIAAAIAGGAGYAWFRSVTAPGLDARQHLNTWPAGLELAGFQVCAVEVDERPQETTAPAGRIAIEVTNRSRSLLEEATFTVRAGSEWHRLRVQNLRPGERRRVERRAPLGVIETQRAGESAGWAKLWWDAVRFADASDEVAVASRPEIADVHPIPDCPRVDISGVWRSATGLELRLTQRGNRPRGQLFPGGREISGTFDGEVFAGNGFQLRFVDERLEGDLGRFERAGDAPPAPPRR